MTLITRKHKALRYSASKGWVKVFEKKKPTGRKVIQRPADTVQFLALLDTARRLGLY